MKTALFAVGLIAVAGVAAAKEVRVDPNARLLACYEEVVVPAQYYVTKEEIVPAEKKYIRRNNRVELIENPAVYKEHRTLKSPRHTVLREIACN